MSKKKLLATLLLVVAATFAAPMAANADQYTDSGACGVSPSTIQGGGTTTLTCQPGTFGDSEDVAYTVSGIDGANAHLASFHVAVSHASVVKLSSPNGSSVLLITVPKSASGAYAITGTGATSKQATSATITVVPADDPASTSTTTSSGSGTGLAKTGSEINGSLVYVGLGLAALGVIVIIVVAARRRRANS